MQRIFFVPIVLYVLVCIYELTLKGLSHFLICGLGKMYIKF